MACLDGRRERGSRIELAEKELSSQRIVIQILYMQISFLYLNYMQYIYWIILHDVQDLYTQSHKIKNTFVEEIKYTIGGIQGKNPTISMVTFIVLYVDDILLIVNDVEISSIKICLSNQFDMKDMKQQQSGQQRLSSISLMQVIKSNPEKD